MTGTQTEAISVRPNVWPVLGGIVLFPLLQYGLPVGMGNDLLAVVVTLAAYPLAIWLYRSVPVAVRSGFQTKVMIAVFVAAVAAIMVSPFAQVYAALANTVMIPAAGIAVGWAVSRRATKLTAYLIGAAVVAIGALAILGPKWELLMGGFRIVGEESIALFKQTMTTMGYHAGAVEESTVQIQKMWNGFVRVIPAMTLMSLVTQFTIGFLWFLMRPGSTSDDSIRMEPFSRWKMPFGLTPVLLVAVIGRLTGGDTVTLVADNVLLVLSIYYCVGGLALLAHGFQRFKVTVLVKIMFYVMLVLAGVIGYVVIGLVGFIDSFADWRKVNNPPIELKTE
jgi:hypothetical protein